jgi:hypothetical protein
MGIINGTPVDEANTNPKFLDADLDDQAQGKIDFVNTDPASGPNVINTQRETNSLNSFTGRSSGSAYNATPSWTNNDVGLSGDNLKTRADNLTQKFNNVSGHAHDGTAGNGALIQSSSLAGVPLAGYMSQGLDLSGVTGSSTDVSTPMTGKVASAGSTIPGVVVNAPYNKIILRQATGPNEDDQFVDGSGNVVYGRLTEAAGVWTLSFYSLVVGTETSYSFASASDVRWYYQELYNPMVNPPVYTELAIIPSDNPTQDILDATTAVKGKVQLATTVTEIGATGSAGTGNATVANADHSHKGVHSLGIDGNPTQGFGDVLLEEGDGIQLAWNGGKIKVSSTGSVGFQEIPSGIVNGVNAVFGPLTYLPSDDNSVLVFIDVYPVPLTTGYTITSGTITFNAGYIPAAGQTVYVFYLTSGTPTVPVMTGTFRTEYRTISLGEETAKSLSLAFTPSTPSYVIVDVIGGSAQEFATDFTVSGSVLSWNGLGLDGVLSTGDKLRICYVT